MARHTKIEWAQASWNPWYGCDRVSPGCAHCYAEAWAKRSGRKFFDNVQRAAPKTFAAPLHWPLARIVFSCSLGDFFHDEADGWRDDAWSVIRQTPHHIYLILTKRPALIPDRLPDDWPLPNAWLGVSAENQRMADERIPALLALPAAARFVSCEPLLGPVDLTHIGRFRDEPLSALDEIVGYIERPPLSWVIVGGESGPAARPMDLWWARDIVSECRSAGVPVFLKQLGGYPDKRGGEQALLDGELVRELPHAIAELQEAR
jgi:protein gp37